VIDLAIPHNEGPAQYDGFVGQIRVILGDNRVRISLEGAVLSIEGRQAYLSLLAENIASLAADNAPLGSHLHIEYHPNHYYLEEGSVPLVVELTEVMAMRDHPLPGSES
jgi:hypothetical protein